VHAIARFARIDDSCASRVRSYASLPQGQRTAIETDEFAVGLHNANLLYLFCSVLIIFDLRYVQRFWPQFEAFLSMRTVTEKGLSPTEEPKLRCHVRCINAAADASEQYKRALLDTWLPKQAVDAHKFLKNDDIAVTNASDKDIQLGKLMQLDEFSRKVYKELKNDRLAEDIETRTFKVA